MSSGFSGGKIACCRLSGSAEDAKVKVKGTRKVGGAGKRKKEWIDPQFPLVLFSCSQFLNSADPSTVFMRISDQPRISAHLE